MSSMSDTYYFKAGWPDLDVVGVDMNIGALTSAKVDAMKPDGYAVVVITPDILRKDLKGISLSRFERVLPLPSRMIEGLKKTDQNLFGDMLNKFKRGEPM